MKTTREAMVGDIILLNDQKYVVEETKMCGGGTGHGPFDIYPDGWHVTARRLNNDGTYDPHGLTKKFYMSGCFTNMITEVEVVGKMKRTFV